MYKRLGNKAVLKLVPLEIAYLNKFGIMPDYHFDRLIEQYGDSEKAGNIVNKNMYGIWTDSCIAHAIREKTKKNGGFVYADITPFDNISKDTVQLLN